MSVKLYRAYDGEGRLLYVGISLCALARLVQHQASAVWFEEAVRLEIEHWHDRGSAEEAERTAIRTEGPLWNKQHALITADGRHVPTNAPELRYEADTGVKDWGLEWRN